MKKFKNNFKKLALEEPDIIKLKNDFFFNLRLAMLTTKTTKSTPPEHAMAQLIEVAWQQFIKDCVNPKIGIATAVDRVFDKYK